MLTDTCFERIDRLLKCCFGGLLFVNLTLKMDVKFSDKEYLKKKHTQETSLLTKEKDVW